MSMQSIGSQLLGEYLVFEVQIIVICSCCKHILVHVIEKENNQ